jgi:hypothetical protein
MCHSNVQICQSFADKQQWKTTHVNFNALQPPRFLMQLLKAYATIFNAISSGNILKYISKMESKSNGN